MLACTLSSLLVVGALAPAPDPAPDSPAPVGGYWLSVDLLGAAPDRAAAAANLAQGVDDRAPRDRPPPGQRVGYVPTLAQAMRWVADHAFARRDGQAPLPGGEVPERFDVQVQAFVITGSTPDGDLRKIDWPLDQSSLIPEGTTWVAADLVPDRAPVFAAPAPVVPAVGERYATARRRGGLFIVGYVERCGPDECVRWAQVVARDRDRFTPGYVPAIHAAPRDTWRDGGPKVPRAQLIASGSRDGRSRWLLIARTRDGELHRKTLEGERGNLSVEGNAARVTFDGAAAVLIELDRSMDARP